MKNFAQSRILSLVALAFALGASGMVSAATATGTLTMTGTVTYIPPPASCTIASQTIDASYAIPTAGAYAYSKNANLAVTCTSGTAYSVSTPASQTMLAMGSEPAGLQVGIISASKNIATFPVTGTGTGSAQSLPVVLNFMASNGNPLSAATTGAVSGTVPLTVTY